MNHLQTLTQELLRIGFEVDFEENFVKIIGVQNSLIEKYPDKIIAEENFSKLLEILQVLIEVEDAAKPTPKILFQDCSLKVYFEGWDFFEIAKIIKFDIAIILNDHGIFNSMGFEIPKDYSDVIVP